MTATTFPMIPTLPPQRAGERPGDYGLRAFLFLVAERVAAELLDTLTLELAHQASHGVVSAREMAPAARTILHNVRTDIATTLLRREREQKAAPAVPSVDPTKPIAGGHLVQLRRPVPIIPPAGATARAF